MKHGGTHYEHKRAGAICILHGQNKRTKKIKEEKDRSFQEYIRKEGKGDPWGLPYKMIRKNRERQIPTNVKKENGEYTEPRQETETYLIKKYFPEDTELEDTQEQRNMKQRARNIREENRDITREEIRQIIKEMPKRKATPIGDIPIAALEHIERKLGDELTKIYNQCLREGVFLRIWKCAELVWIPKKGTEVRPIALLPTLGKLLDKIVAGRISYYLEADGKLDKEQYGFRQGRGSTDAIKRQMEEISTNKEYKRHTLLIALDMRNVFNSGWITSVIIMMRKLELPQNLIRISYSFLVETKVKTETLEKEIERGCPQGSSLGPILWLVIMQEFFASLRRKIGNNTDEVIAYADGQ